MAETMATKVLGRLHASGTLRFRPWPIPYSTHIMYITFSISLLSHSYSNTVMLLLFIVLLVLLTSVVIVVLVVIYSRSIVEVSPVSSLKHGRLAPFPSMFMKQSVKTQGENCLTNANEGLKVEVKGSSNWVVDLPLGRTVKCPLK